MPALESLSAAALRSTVVTFRDTMKVHQAGINRLNVYPVPDGDTGTNMARTLDAVVAELELLDQLPDADPGIGATCDAISHGSLMGARGNSGVILSQILRGLASTLKDAGEATGAKVADALTAASAAAYQAVLKPIEGTILTVVRAAAEGASAASHDGANLAGVLRAARTSARENSSNGYADRWREAAATDHGGRRRIHAAAGLGRPPSRRSAAEPEA